MYETPNRGIVLEPKKLWIKEWPMWHQMSLIGVGAKREVWTKGPRIRSSYRMQSLVKRIRSDVYPRKGVIPIFQVSSRKEKSRRWLVNSGPWKIFKSRLCE
jgi:hypothetical protein